MIDFFTSRMLEQSGFPCHGFTKRVGGVSMGPFSGFNLAYDVGDYEENVAHNLGLLKAALKIDTPLLRVKQVHGSLVVDAAALVSKKIPLFTDPPEYEADGIVSFRTQAVLGVQTADCAPVLLACPATRTVAAIHAGWRGAAKGILETSVRAMTDKGAILNGIVAAIGPCICPRCYEVGEEVAEHFPQSCKSKKSRPGKYDLDLGLAVRMSLLDAGIEEKNIDCINACSCCLEKDLFSYRRASGPTGRSLGFISG